jgi:allatostatin receptor
MENSNEDCGNSSFDIFLNDTFITENTYTPFELKIAILIGITFTITLIVGIIGNSLVLLTILIKKQMRSSTNILILNLAIAELLFILLCVPFTGLNYVLSVWHFGDVICRIVQVIIFVIFSDFILYTSTITTFSTHQM